MATVSTELAQVQTNLNTIGTGITSLDSQIQALQQQIANGGSTLTAADQAALDAIVAQSGQLATQANAVVTPPPTPTPSPTPPPAA